MATNDLYRLTLHGTYNTTTPFLNVFYYIAIADSTQYSPTTTLGSFVDNLFPSSGAKLLDNIHSTVTFTLVEWAPITDETQTIGSVAISTTGLQGGDAMPSFCAYAFRYYPTVLHRRSGYKRFCGMPEGSQAGGVISSSLSSWGNTVSSTLLFNLVDGDDVVTYQPTIVSFTLNGEPRTVPVHTAISDIQMRPTVSTQNTRKR